MAKTIKRVGIIFFVLVLSCLLLLGVGYAFNSVPNDLESDTDNSTIVNIEYPTVATEDQVHLSGNSAEMLTNWKKALARSKNENKIIEVVLDNDWVLTEQLNINYGEEIAFDLNGHTISRNLTQFVANGRVFLVIGRLYITDRVYLANSDEIKQQVATIYENFKIDINAEFDPTNQIYDEKIVGYLESFIEKFDSINCGKVTGGYTTGGGGGIAVVEDKGKVGSCFVYGGLFYNNRAQTYGGALYAGMSGVTGKINDSAKLSIMDGIIAGNRAESGGGGLYLRSCYSKIHNAYFCGNISINNAGGGIYAADSTDIGISNINVFCNYARYGTGFYAAGAKSSNNVQVATVIEKSIFSKNIAFRQGGGIYTTNYTITALKDVTITENFALCRVEDEARGGGGLQAYYGAYVEADRLVLKNNYSKIRGGGIYVYPDAHLVINGKNDIAENYDENGVSDLYLSRFAKLDVASGFAIGDENGEKNICVELAEDYGKYIPFTTGWQRIEDAKGFEIDPSTYFYSKNNELVAKKINGEIVFVYNEVTWSWGENANDKTIDSYKELTYNGQEYEITCSAGDFYFDNAIGASAKIKNAGTYNFWIGGKDSATTIAPAFTVVILPKQVDLEWGNSLTYNGQKIIPNVKVKDGQLCVGDTTDITVLSSESINVGENYSATAVGLSNQNYTINSTTSNTNYQIKPKDLTITIETKNIEKEYTGKQITLLDDWYTLTTNGLVGQDSGKTINELFVINKDGIIPEFANNQIPIVVGEYGLGVKNIEDIRKVFTGNNNYNITIDYVNSGKLNIVLSNIVRTSVESGYDYLMIDNDRRVSYKDRGMIHGVDDSNVNAKAGNAQYVLGNIMPETTVQTLLKGLVYNQKNGTVVVYDKQGNRVDNNAVVGTGWYIEYANERIYLSVLGDVTGDGRIDATDITYIRRIANGEIDKATLNPAVLLSAMVDNRGGVTSIDAEILRAVCKYEITIDIYF